MRSRRCFPEPLEDPASGLEVDFGVFEGLSGELGWGDSSACGAEGGPLVLGVKLLLFELLLRLESIAFFSRGDALL